MPSASCSWVRSNGRMTRTSNWLGSSAMGRAGCLSLERCGPDHRPAWLHSRAAASCQCGRARPPGAVDTGHHLVAAALGPRPQQGHSFAQGGVPGLIRWRFRGWRAGAAVVIIPGCRSVFGLARVPSRQLFDAGKAPREAAQLQLQLCLAAVASVHPTLPGQMLAISQNGERAMLLDVLSSSPAPIPGVPELLQPVGRQAAVGASVGVVFRRLRSAIQRTA